VPVSKFFLALMVLVALAFVVQARDVKRSSANQQCETENITDSQVRECSIRRRLQAELDQAEPSGTAAGH
jgi:hypothetical protein